MARILLKDSATRFLFLQKVNHKRMTMLKARFTIAALAMGVVAFAQERPLITSAKLSYDKAQVHLATQQMEEASAKLQEAVNYINEAKGIIEGKAEDDLRESTMQKYYLYRGDIYSSMSSAGQVEGWTMDSASVASVESYINEALGAYKDLVAYEIKIDDDDYTEQVQGEISKLVQQLSMVAEAWLFDVKSNANAYETYERVYELRAEAPINQVDTATLYNLARLATSMDQTETALGHYQSLMDYGYKGITWTALYEGNRVTFPDKSTLDYYIEQGMASEPQRSESRESDLWVNALWIIRGTGDTARFETMLTNARAKFPQNDDILKLQLQNFLDAKDYDGALASLQSAVESDPGNALYLYNIGFIYHQEKGDVEQGLVWYQKAIDADSTYADALYMAGLAHIDKSNTILEEMGKLGRNEQRKYDSLDKDKDALLQKALEYFLKADAVLPNDRATIQALSEVYYKLGNAEKALEYRDILNGLPE